MIYSSLPGGWTISPRDRTTGMRKKLEGGSNLFGGWDIVRVLHAHDDPPDVLRCLHGSVGTLESSDDRKQGFSSIDAVLDVLIEEVEPVVLEGS
ncbi:hypothetical protein [Halorubrum sp. Atlit-26R]|uniref:hypothetical protein n=1 Tax=Halorubrum sp. Atlit-26R TaxID=2282128 RepID=UPI00131467EB|nr:hypothetical protein [Halorubrum sp. Atlit-26R]